VFIDEARAACRLTGGSLCIGLDPHPDLIPQAYGSTLDGLRAFLTKVVEQTLPHAGLYKPNAAFYEALGPDGLTVLKEVIDLVHAAGRPVILDAKRGDIASTARAYARAAFDVLEADAITIVPYMGEDAVVPFLDRDRFVFLLALPSNPSAEEIVGHGSPPLYERVCRLALDLDARYPKQVGLVVGATRPEQARVLHDSAPNLPWLVPGVGAQGGSLGALSQATAGRHEAWVNVSRAILFDPEPGKAAMMWRQKIGEWRHG
jgi:orotidine 5'-phosphate decarboxylase subfamily 2